MSLNFELRAKRPTTVFESNVTHNLGRMAKEAGVYDCLWGPREAGHFNAGDLIPDLERGLADLEARPKYFKQLNPENGWGTYEGLVEVVRDTLRACRANPDAEIHVWR